MKYDILRIYIYIYNCINFTKNNIKMINKNSFINLLTRIENNQSNPYIGMGNPDSDTLFVGSEKALDENNPVYTSILEHELFLNYNHWKDIVNNFGALTDPFDNILLERSIPLSGFNPFNPLLFRTTAQIVQAAGAGHTYYGLQRLLNSYEVRNSSPLSTLFNPIFSENTFSKCFITEISASPALQQTEANFKLSDFFNSDRYNFMTGSGSEFYQDFKKIVIYCGRNNRYVGKPDSNSRLKILQIFNPSIHHNHRRVVSENGVNFDVYENGAGAKLILCRHFSSGFGHVQANEIANEML